jgi:AraC-like DNA-binding protein
MTAITALVRSMDPGESEDAPPPSNTVTRVASREHKQAQLIYVRTGALRVTTAIERWTVPPLRAVWIPAETRHDIVTVGETTMRTLHVELRLAAELWTECRVIEVTGLLRALILQIPDEPPSPSSSERGGLMTKLLLHELQDAAAVPLQLPLPRDARLLKICLALIERPGSNDTLDAWAARAGVSTRTVARLFKTETGLSFAAWRQHLRLAESLCRLVAGTGVADVASRLGYRSSSAFITMFRRALGDTPHRYLRSQRGDCT